MTNAIDVKFISPIVAEDEEFENPIDISDIINVCKEYSRLGWQIQNQIENITELGIDEAIRTGAVKTASLPHIKNFLKAVSENPLFGDASAQSEELIAMIENYESEHPQDCSLKN